MEPLNDLYQAVIIDHSRHPRNFRKISVGCTEEGYNPLCGDRVIVYIKTNKSIIEEVSFEGEGCAISQASASLMTETVKGKTIAEANRIFDAFHQMLTDTPSEKISLGKLEAFQGVREFPMRVKCATLAWHTLMRLIRSNK